MNPVEIIRQLGELDTRLEKKREERDLVRAQMSGIVKEREELRAKLMDYVAAAPAGEPSWANGFRRLVRIDDRQVLEIQENGDFEILEVHDPPWANES